MKLREFFKLQLDSLFDSLGASLNKRSLGKKSSLNLIYDCENGLKLKLK